MVKELKEAHTAAPPLFAISPNWTLLPALPYTAFEITPYPMTSGNVLEPAVPALRKFNAQIGDNNKEYKWFPNPDKVPEESNSLVFYSAPAPAAGMVSNLQRISYYLDTSEPNNFKLIREMQSPLSNSSTNFHSSPNPLRTVIVETVETIQYTYPLFTRQMEIQGDALHDQLNTMQINEGNNVLQSFLSQNFRKVIGLKIILAGARIGQDNFKGIELETEVRLRNE